MEDHLKFVQEFVVLMSATLGDDDVSKKRKKCIDELKQPLASGRNALNVRFALGGDDSLYLQAGVALLHVDKHERFELAPARLYSSDVLEATKRGLLAAKKVANARRRSQSQDELKALFRAFYEYATIFLPDTNGTGLNNDSNYRDAETAVRVAKQAVQRLGAHHTPAQRAQAINGVYDSSVNTTNAMKELIRFFFDVINPHDKVTQMLSDIVQSAYGTPADETPVLSPGSTLRPATTAMSFPKDAMVSGICDHVAPHETGDGCSGVDAMVDYSAPADIELTLKLSKMFLSSASHKEIRESATSTPDAHPKVDRIGDLAFIEAIMALDGKHTLLDHNAAKGTHPKTALRWEPSGEHGDDFASAAVLGHIIGRINQVAQNDLSISTPAKELLMHSAAVLKIRQLDNMRVVQNAVRMGTAPALMIGTPLPPQPVIPSSPSTVNDGISVRDYIEVLVDRGMFYAFIPDDVDLKRELDNALPSGGAKDRLSGLRTEMMRNIAISTDRLWGFIRTLSGLIGEGAETLISTADEASMRAAQQVEAQRKQIVDRVAQFQSSVVETLISGLLKDSTLQLSTGTGAANSMVVVDGDTAKQIRDLASGESGRPFFEANVALRNITESTKTQPRKLSDVVSMFGSIAETLKLSLERDLLPSAGVAGATLAELSMPRNSYFVRLRDDTAAAIRAAFDRFVVESSLNGMRHVYLWELIEGGDHMLTSRFAEFVGHVLIQNRTSTGISAIYTSRQQATLNAAQARVAFARLLNQAHRYTCTVPAPNFQSGGVVASRADYFAHAALTETPSLAWSTGGPLYDATRHMRNLGGWHGGVSY